MAIPTRAEVDALVRTRLADDPGFREQLMADPRAAVSALIGMDVPDAAEVSVHEESLTAVHLVIPAAVADELTEDQLESVAGGVCWGNCSDYGP
jgi:hypothetical protein